MIALEDTLFPHIGGSLIYVPLTNSIFCLGGQNSKKCEFYKNNKILSNNSSINEKKYPNDKWFEAPEFNLIRMEFSSIVINRFIYVFFGQVKSQMNSIERLNLIKNESWELINLNSNLGLSYNLRGNGILPLNGNEILLLGGSDEKGFLMDSIFSYNCESNIIRKFEYKIPNINWWINFNFKREANFTKVICFNINENKAPKYCNVDGLNRIHLINTNRFDYFLKEDKNEI